MESELLRRALEVVSRGPVTKEVLASKLGVSYSEAEALVGALLAHGLVREVDPSLCASCPLAGRCPAKAIRGVKVYELTEKARVAKLARGNF